jgi:glycosyltransferase involved in cell wall biosynthesis
LNLQNNFRLPGALPQAYQYLPAFDVFALSSVKEGFSYTILEAMQAARPIVATAVGGTPEMIKDQENGLLVKPADPEVLAQAILKLIKNKDLAEKLGRQAKIDEDDKFCLEKMVAATKKIYSD